jgi:hypothetical protein
MLIADMREVACGACVSRVFGLRTRLSRAVGASLEALRKQLFLPLSFPSLNLNRFFTWTPSTHR